MVCRLGARSPAICCMAWKHQIISSTWRSASCIAAFQLSSRRSKSQSATGDSRKTDLLNAWNSFRLKQDTQQSSCRERVGFVGKRRNVSKHLSFADLTLPNGEIIQLCSSTELGGDAHAKFRSIQAHAPVSVQIHDTPSIAGREDANAEASKPTVYVKDIRSLNTVPHDLIVTPDSQFPPSKRHLQIRFHPELQARLKFRSWLKGTLNEALLEKGFVDVETPTLFKSTPEGAREFLVPTRQKGTAYALSQSPQQYKQALMASGITRYMQWARCYRDEDTRADRQPEFSQLDMEWAFAGAATVLEDVNDIVLKSLKAIDPAHNYQDIRGLRIPVLSQGSTAKEEGSPNGIYAFESMTFEQAIDAFGSDKPDLRIPGRIRALPDLNPYRQFVGMITHLNDPIVEVFTLGLKEQEQDSIRKFVINFMDNLPQELADNPDGKPQVLIFDSSKPLGGLSSLGHEYDKILDLVGEGRDFNDGDLIVFQARPRPPGQYCQGSTKLGDLRRDLWKALVERGYMDKPRLGEPGSLRFAWITEFPMFKPTEEGEPGQGGAAGISACHHPFTAPLSQADLELLFSQPLEAKSAAYDLVLNGVEIGGGSERNHVEEIQDFIMRDVLKMDKERIKDFAHLFDVLRSGCPPHAGFALGFDRLAALLSDTPTVRDVIAFPKTMRGEDPFVKSPSRIANEQLKPYGLQHMPRKQA